MNRLQKVAIILDLAHELKRKGSWCGELHLQKAVYFLQELVNIPTLYEFILYKYGPFSFELRDELTSMRADGLIKLQLQPSPYGPSLVITEHGEKLKNRFPLTINRYNKKIKFVAKIIGNKDADALEQLSTAFYVTREKLIRKDVNKRAHCIRKLKPQISQDDATNAIRNIDDIINNPERKKLVISR